jgi:TPR repeat protein
VITPNSDDAAQAAAFTAHLERARAGEIDSQLEVARCYAWGTGVPPDERLAADWFEKAAGQGSAFAQYEMAGRYMAGLGREKDEATALLWYRKAAEQNHPPALSSLGYLYDQGEIVPRDDAQAAYWYKRSLEHNEQIIRPHDHEEIFWQRRAAAGDPQAQTIIGWFYQSGFGREQNDAKAVELYRKAAEQNFGEAERHLAHMYRRGAGVPQDDRLADHWLARARQHGDPQAGAFG